MARGTPGAISLGPGTLYIAAIGSTEPTDLTTAWPAAWVSLGYTNEGSQFSYELSTGSVEVAEELDPIRIVAEGREIKVGFELAEITATNLKRAMNGGTITAGAGFVTFTPPELGTETRTMLGFDSEDKQERWLFRQCFQTGNIAMQRRKGTDKTVIPVEYQLEKPANVAPFQVFDKSPERQ